MYSIINKATRQWVYGTDYRKWPPQQRTSSDQALTYDTLEYAKRDFRSRKCDKRVYEIVKVKLEIVGD